MSGDVCSLTLSPGYAMFQEKVFLTLTQLSMTGKHKQSLCKERQAKTFQEEEVLLLCLEGIILLFVFFH